MATPDAQSNYNGFNAVAFNGMAVACWEGLHSELWVSCNRGIRGFVGVQGGWSTPTALVPAVVAPAKRIYGPATTDAGMCFGHMGFCWIVMGYTDYPNWPSLSGSVGVQISLVSKDFGATWEDFDPPVATSVGLGTITRYSIVGNPGGMAGDVADHLTCITNTGPVLVQIRDNTGDTASQADVVPFVGAGHVGVARVKEGWVVGGPGNNFRLVTGFPTFTTTAEAMVLSSNVSQGSGSTFGGGQRPQGFSWSPPGGGVVTDVVDPTYHMSTDHGFVPLRYTPSGGTKTPILLVTREGVVAGDDTSDARPVYLERRFAESGLRDVSVDLEYGGTDLLTFELRTADTGESVAMGGTVAGQYIAAGTDGGKWYIDIVRSGLTTHEELTEGLVPGQTYRLRLEPLNKDTGFFTGRVRLYVDDVLKVEANDPTSTLALAGGNAYRYSGFLMNHAAFPCVSSKVRNFCYNPIQPNLGVSLTAAVVGTPGNPLLTSAHYSYYIMALDAGGKILAYSVAAQTTTSNATLSSANYNLLTWTAVAGAASYDLYRLGGDQASGLLVSGLGSGTLLYHDNGTDHTTAGTFKAWPLSVHGSIRFDALTSFIGSVPIEDHVADTGERWTYGQARMAIGSGAVKSHSHTLTYAGVLVSEEGLDGCQAATLSVTPDILHGDWSAEVRVRHNGLGGIGVENYAVFGYVLSGGSGHFYLYDDLLGGTVVNTAAVLVNNTAFAMRIEVDAVSVRGYKDGALIATAAGFPSVPKGFMGWSLQQDTTALTKVNSFVASSGCGTVADLPGVFCGLARGPANSLVGIFKKTTTVGSNVTSAWYMGWSADNGRVWTTQVTPFLTQTITNVDPIPYNPKLIPIEGGSVAVVWRDLATDLPQHKISRDGGRTII